VDFSSTCASTPLSNRLLSGVEIQVHTRIDYLFDEMLKQVQHDGIKKAVCKVKFYLLFVIPAYAGIHNKHVAIQITAFGYLFPQV